VDEVAAKDDVNNLFQAKDDSSTCFENDAEEEISSQNYVKPFYRSVGIHSLGLLNHDNIDYVSDGDLFVTVVWMFEHDDGTEEEPYIFAFYQEHDFFY
jgi:hypothetical protein